MGLIERIVTVVFGGGRNIVAETAEVFRENAEASAQRGADERSEALAQFTAEFAARERGLFDRIMDGMNRLPRPAMALGTLGLFVAAMVDPVWFSARMQGIALVPEPLWWLLGVIVSFYFGARHQYKNQELQRTIAGTLARTPQVVENLENLRALRMPAAAAKTEGDAAQALASLTPEPNPALEEWRRRIA